MDRNIGVGTTRDSFGVSLSARRAWIEIDEDDPDNLWSEVALRKESVDRNNTPTAWYRASDTSLSARRAWIEMPTL